MKKKLLNLWRGLTRRWLKTDVADPKDYLKVHVLNENSDILHEVLGITDERKDVLTRECEVLLAKYDDTSQAAVEMSAKVLHANELFYCSYLISHIVDSKRRMGGLAGLLMGAARKKGPDKSEDN